jgi:Xaa-Pro aminopeptidase
LRPSPPLRAMRRCATIIRARPATNPSADHFYLNDSGGQYVNGTTDATRTRHGEGRPQQRCTTPC